MNWKELRDTLIDNGFKYRDYWSPKAGVFRDDFEVTYNNISYNIWKTSAATSERSFLEPNDVLKFFNIQSNKEKFEEFYTSMVFNG